MVSGLTERDWMAVDLRRRDLLKDAARARAAAVATEAEAKPNGAVGELRRAAGQLLVRAGETLRRTRVAGPGRAPDAVASALQRVA